MGAELTYVGVGKPMNAAVAERLQSRGREKAASKEDLFSDYERTRDQLQSTLGSEIHQVFTEVFSPNASFAGAKETQGALAEVTTDAFILKTLSDRLRADLPNGPSTLFGDAAVKSGEAMLQQKLSERVLRLMDQEHLFAGDETLDVVQEGIHNLVGSRLSPMTTTAPERILSRDMVPAVMQTALTYLQEGDHLEVQAALDELDKAMRTSGTTLADHDRVVQEKLAELKKMVHATLFSQSLPVRSLGGKNIEPDIVQDNDIYNLIHQNLVEGVSQETALAIVKNELSVSEARVLQRAYDENEKGVDAFAQFSRKAVAGGTLLLVLTPLLQSCNSLLPPGGTPAPIPTGKPTNDHHDQTPSATPSIVRPETTSTPPVIIGNMPNPLALSGLPPGVGGTGELVMNPLSKVQAAINAKQYGVVYAGDTVSVESAHAGTNLCFSIIPASIFDPDHVSDPKGDLLLRQENGVAKYGFNQVLAEVLLPQNTATDTYSCVLGYALSGNQEGYKAGTLRMLLMRTNSNGSVDVVGSMQAGFASTENVQVRDGVVFVNGEKQDWTLFPNMVLTTPTKIPTLISTETPVLRQVDLVFGLDNITVPDSCKVVPVATADNTLTLNGQPLPDGTVIDTYDALVDIRLGKYNQPMLLIAARAVAIEKFDPIQINNEPVDRYLLCYNVKLPSGDNMVIASVFINSTQSGFQNTGVYELPGTDVAGVTLDQTAAQPTPIKVIRNSDFLALFASGKIIGQQVLLPFAYDYPSANMAAGENTWRGAIVAALKSGRLPLGGYFHSVYATPIGGDFVAPASLVP